MRGFLLFAAMTLLLMTGCGDWKQKYPSSDMQQNSSEAVLTNINKGEQAAEIEGQDFQGHPFRLNDFRGKVVLLDFWASWCGPCMGLVPHERALAERLADKPFALLGVNVDGDNEKALQAGFEWRCWWDGQSRIISKRWAVKYLPTIVILDGNGVIRERVEGAPSNPKLLDDIIDQLIAEFDPKAEKVSS